MVAHCVVLHGFVLGAIRLLFVPHIYIGESSASIAHILHAFLEEGLVFLLKRTCLGFTHLLIRIGARLLNVDSSLALFFAGVLGSATTERVIFRDDVSSSCILLGSQTTGTRTPSLSRRRRTRRVWIWS